MMGLTCDCDVDWYPDPGEWYWNGSPSEYKPLPFKRSKRCCSCNELIRPGELSVQHSRGRIPDSDIEIGIYGEDGEIPIASDWMCEKCSDLFFSLAELGYCVLPRDDMRELVHEYAQTHNQENGDV